ncbi:MAG: D-2-hydroxyacid dehydrogenase [Bacteroidota bacterium]
MKPPQQLLITYPLTQSQLRRITEASTLVEVCYAPNIEEARGIIASTEILFGDIPKEQFLLMRRLKWVQISTVGADRFLYPELLQSDVALCCSRGMHKYQMTELLFAMMIGITRKLFLYHDLQKEAEWTAAFIKESDVITGKTLGIVGLGSIGSLMAKVAHSFGMRVIGTKRTPQPVEFVDEVLAPSQLEILLRVSDHVVNVTPLTPLTVKMFGEKEFAAMKPDAIFYNFGRGASVDADALIRALERGTIKAAALDTFEEEPLPRNNPLWNAKNVFITPHIGGPIPHYYHLLTEIFIDNLKRYLSGKPFATAVDKAKGY